MEQLILSIQNFASDEELQQLMEAVPDISHAWNEGLTPLGAAVCAHNVRAVQLLIQNGVDINGYSKVRDERYRIDRTETAMITAARVGHLDIIQILFDSGADIHLYAQDCSMNALHWACNMGHTEIVRYLVGHGAKINAPGEYNFTPLMEATLQNHFLIAKFLIDSGSDLDVSTTENQETAMLIALILNFTDIAEYLVQAGSDVNDVDGSGIDALASTIAEGNVSLCKMLVLAGSSVKTQHIAKLSYLQDFEKSLLPWLIEEKKTPTSLMRQSRITIRRQLIKCSQNTSILGRVARLPVPIWLKDYLMLKIL